jgi:hypothetical protein
MRLLTKLLKDIGFDIPKMDGREFKLSNYYIDLLSDEDLKIFSDKNVEIKEEKLSKEEKLYKRKYLKYKHKYMKLKNKNL